MNTCSFGIGFFTFENAVGAQQRLTTIAGYRCSRHDASLTSRQETKRCRNNFEVDG